jgi:glutathione synthase/RimK-type ligase-like ATP-grasp enzyme
MAFQSLSVLIPIALSAVGFATTVNGSRRAGEAVTGRGHRPSALILNGEALLADAESGGPFADGVDTVFRGIDDLAFAIETGRVCLYETVDGRDLAEFALVQVAAYPRPTATLLNAIADYLRHRRVRAVNMAGVSAPTKLFQYVRFAQAGLPVPATVCLAPRLLVDSYQDLVERLGLPFVLKAIGANGGRYNHLIGNERDFGRRLGESDDRCGRHLVQEFIPSDTTLRLLVLGGGVRVATRQTGVGGGQSVLVDVAGLDPAVKGLAVRAAALIGCDVAGVDLIQHWTTRQWYVLDATSNPAIGTGAFADAKLGAYSSYLRRSVGG